MSNDDLSLIEELILVELAGGKDDAAATRSDLQKATSRLTGLTRAKLDVGPALSRLTERLLLEELPRAPRQRAARWRILPAGRESLRESLGSPMAQQGRTWKQKAARALAARRFLGLAPRAAAALVEQGGLPVYFLAARLGEDFQPGMTLDSLARRAAAAMLGLSNDQIETLWQAVVQGALAGGSAASAAKDKANAAPGGRPESDGALPFSVQIDAAADAAREGWFGPRKLFIHRAWEAWKTVYAEGVDLAGFKARLLESLKAGEMGLARADFTAGMNAADLEQAETRYGDEVFHFINFPYDKHQG